MRIEFNKIRFKNFLCFGSRQQEVDLLNGLNLVVGIDEDNENRSNGSGKTSLLETIPFALYGVTHKLVKKSDIINWKNRKNCEVIIDFSKGNNEYSILRSIKPNNLEIYKNGSLVDRPPHVRDYQKILDDIIGLNFQSFISLIHSNINSSMPITTMNKPDKRKFMEKIFKLKIYSDMNEKCNEKIRNLNEKIISYDKDIGFNNSKIDLSETEIKNLNEKIKTYSEKEEKYKKYSKEYKEKIKEHDGINDEFENLNLQLSDLSISSTNLNNIISKIKTKSQIVDMKIKNIDSQINELLIEIEKSKESIDYQQKIYYITEKYGDIDKIQEDIDNYYDKIESEENKKNKDIVEKEDVQRVIITMESQIRNIKDKISSLESHNVCPLCEQPIKGDLNIVEKWELDLYEIEVQLKQLYLDLKKIEMSILSIDNLILKYKDKIKNKRRIKEGISKLKLKLSEYNVEENKSKIKILKLKKKKYLSVKSKLDNIMKITVEKENSINKYVDNYMKDKEKIERVINNLQKLEKNLEVIKREVKMEQKMRNDIYSQIKNKKENILDLKKNIKSLLSEMKRMKSVIDYLTFIKETCKDENIKQFAISSNIPYLNEKLNHYLSQVGHNFYVILDNWLETTIKGPGIFNGSYGSLSAGESKCIDLAMQFAFLDISRMQSGAFIDTLIEDEILDSSVDGIGLHKVMDILKLKQKEDNLKTFIISHRNEIDNLDIDQIYQVVKKNGYSTVKII